jgi:hypothetical protein
MDTAMTNYEAPSVDLESREYQENASWHLYYTTTVPNYLVHHYVVTCKTKGLLYFPSVSWGWLRSTIRCWRWSY